MKIKIKKKEDINKIILIRKMKILIKIIIIILIKIMKIIMKAITKI